ncbi:MAG TPA: hypothetical protein VKT82_33770 [Ktedonobacterales bacterium]|nr:hypothetical protein [Ktedonobacterales bacterium]
MRRLKAYSFSALLLMTIFATMFIFSGSVSAAGRSAGAPLSAAGKPSKSSNIKAEGNWFQLSHFGTTTPAPDARMNALQQASRLPTLASTGGPESSTLPAATWTPLGPQPIDTSACSTNCNNYGLNSGRITAMAVNPTNSNDLWAGAADGGVWHSTDGGAHWTPVSDSWPTLSIGSIAIDPHNANTIYVGTGEGNLNADAFWGAGIFKSTDGGAHWTQLGFSHFGGLGISKIAVDPNNSSIVLAAATFDGATTPPGGAPGDFSNGGIWRSTDGGSTWTLVKSNTVVAADFGSDVVFDPAHAGVAFAGLANSFGFSTSTYTSIAGVYKSTNDGATWSLLSAGIPTGNNVERVSLGISHDGQHLYAVLTDGGLGGAGSAFGNLLNSAIYVSTTNGSSWTAQNVSGVTGMVNDDGGQQWWYDTYVAVDPTDATGNTAYVGGVDVWQTTTGGTSWTNLTNAYTGGNVHPDQHALAFLSNSSSSYYIGNDGGVWSGTSGGAFTNLNGGGLDITQFYGGSVGETGSDAQLYGGAQDNGENQFPLSSALNGPATWTESFGGDGGDTVVDYTDNSVVYEEYVFGAISKSTDGGATWNPATTGLAGSANFIMPFIMSPNNHLELLAGTNAVYRTTNGASSWVAISPVLDNGTSISALAVAPGHDNVIYAGDNAGHIFVTTNGGTTWSKNVAPSGSTGGMVTGLAVDPTNPAIVYATFANFAPNAGHHVFKSTNSGTSWTDISASLPNIPFESVLVSPINASLVIAGSDAGIFASQNGGSTWARLGSGLPNVAVDQVFLDHNGTRVFVATHGRGMWVLPIGSLLANPSGVGLTTAPGVTPGTQTITLSNTGMGNLPWSASLPTLTPSGWVSISGPSSGTIPAGGTQTITLTFNTPSIASDQTYTTNLTVSSPVVGASPLTIPITLVAANVSKTWYFAEGFTGTGFTEYLTLANPNDADNLVTVQYLLQGASPITKQYTVHKNSRYTLNINSEIGAGQNVSMVVTGSLPLIAERPMYFNFGGTIPGGSDVLGATSLSQDFDFGYLDNTANHHTYLSILNPNPNPNDSMDVQITYLSATGQSTVIHHSVSGDSRGTVPLATEGLPAGTYSALVHLSEPGLVERPMYLIDGTTGYTGAADVVGVATPLMDWDFAEGFTSSTFSERYILSNPGATTATGTVTFFLASGPPVTKPFSLAPGAQTIIPVNALLSGNNSAHVSASQPILAERFMSFKFGTSIPGATDVLGAAAPSDLSFFAEGFTGTGFSEYLTIENPSATDTATVIVTFLPANGSAPVVRVYTIAPSSRFTLPTGTVMPGQSFSMVVESNNVPIVAERSMYFNFSGGRTGGSDVVGYQP